MPQWVLNNLSFDTPRKARLLRKRVGCCGTGPSIRLALQAYSGTGRAVAEQAPLGQASVSLKQVKLSQF
ncbi:MAG: hypothetical protein NZM15_04110 [Flavobacteriales bacterium]|nr:hypothetical protein [Flavobacteriales bacterium]MDW8431869.1 hypothetical protein [Flavobacteriales bacterium]